MLIWEYVQASESARDAAAIESAGDVSAVAVGELASRAGRSSPQGTDGS